MNKREEGLLGSIRKHDMYLYNNIASKEKIAFDMEKFKEKYPSLKKILIEVAFYQSKYKDLKRYCNDRNKKTLYDLDNIDIVILRLQRNIGEVRYGQIIKKLSEIKSDIVLNEEATISKYNSQKVLINDIFSGAKYKDFREFCDLEKIYTVGSLNEEVLLSFLNIRGIGYGSVERILDRLEKIGIYLKHIKEKSLVNMDKIKVKYENILKIHTIDSVFFGPKFGAVRFYCISKGILTLNDLTNEDIIEIKKYRQIGKKRYGDFIDTLKYNLDKLIEDKEMLAMGKFQINHDVYEKYKDIKLSTVMKAFNIKDIGLDLYIRDIQGKTYDEIIELGGKKELSMVNQLDILLFKLKKMKSIDEIIKMALDNLNDREKKIINYRYTENMTLEKIGLIFEVNRERIRQIEVKALKNMRDIFYKYGLINNFKLRFNSCDYFFLKYMEEILEEENLFIVNIIRKEKFEDLYYFKDLDVVFFYDVSKEKKESIQEGMYDIID